MRVEEHFFITLRDGCRLAARAWFPDAARAPAILEYIPYRKRDGTRGRDDPMHGYFAEHGYVAVRVDMRGSGESDGLLLDEYLQAELDDAYEVIDWLSRQPWCDGNVGMMGKSWGGFNALQVAAMRPPALKAILTVCSTDDRYADDIHYMGGCLLNDNLWWGAIMLTYQARPPDPALREDWREVWLERLDNMPFWPALWLQHQKRDEYWRHGSVCEDFAKIECPVFAVGGWADAYTNAIPRLLEGLKVPRLGLIGPWAHLYPHDGKPGPSIGFLQEAASWWGRWLKGADNGVMNQPMLRAFIEDGGAPEDREHAAGRFVGEAQWPSPGIANRTVEVSAAGLDAPASPATATIRSPCWTGSTCGEWMGAGAPHEAPADQRLDDGFSLCFDSVALDAPLTLLGAPEIEFEVASDQPVAQLCARLCDVSPVGASRRVSYGVLNLTHRNGHLQPEPLTPGAFVRVRLKLNDCGYAFAPGHRLRLALSTAYWPLIWPAPAAATLAVRLPGSLRLPVRTSGGPEIHFPPRESGPGTRKTALSWGRVERRVGFDFGAGVSTYETVAEGGLFGEGAYRFDEIDTSVSHDLRRRLRIGADDPLSAAYEFEQTYEMGRENWRIRIETKVSMRASATHFFMEGTLSAFENDSLARSRSFNEAIARDEV